MQRAYLYNICDLIINLMEKFMIEQVYAELKKLDAVTSSNQFSRDWLGMEKSYFRTMKAKNRKPSAKVLARVSLKLKESGTRLEKNADPRIAIVGHRLIIMSDKCMKMIFDS